MADKYDARRVPQALKDALLEVVLIAGKPGDAALQALREAARLPLRTRAAVDAEIVAEVRNSHDVAPFYADRGSPLIERIRKLCDEPTADPEPNPEHANPLVRIQWQCSSCGWGYFGTLQETCPGCGARGFWSGSVVPDCKPWPGYPCAPAPGVRADPVEPDKLVEQTLAADEPEPCGCEQTDALKAQLDRCRAIVRSWLQDTVDCKSARIALERELVRELAR